MTQPATTRPEDVLKQVQRIHARVPIISAQLQQLMILLGHAQAAAELHQHDYPDIASETARLVRDTTIALALPLEDVRTLAQRSCALLERLTADKEERDG